ncbi:hypothetical protein BCR42DRAFT_488586 [Absidia repens]|uniref:DUF221-domain-containing protein n=1 Tax=Absidia repens TaxID=90262 RepID=A0A1X2ISN9_9FUNG|nr:hypothetical protein BCR42DRAFT_488586 [Absidia repens]
MTTLNGSSTIAALPSLSSTPTSIISQASTTTMAAQSPGVPDPPAGSTAYSAKQNQSGLTTQLIICFSVGLLCFLTFCFLRTRWPVIFAPRKNMRHRKPPRLPNTFFGWIIPLIRISKTQMLDRVGLDAVIMLDFIVMGIKIFGLCSFFGVAVLIPISSTTGNFTTPRLNPVDHLSITVISESSPYLIAYLIFTYFFTFVTWFFLQQNYDSYIYMRARYLLQLSSSLVCKSVIVTGLPDELRTDQALADYFENLGIGMVASCHVVRHVKKLGHILRQRARALDKLEESYVKYWGNPCRNTNYAPSGQIVQYAQTNRHQPKLEEQHTPIQDQINMNSAGAISADEDIRNNTNSQSTKATDTTGNQIHLRPQIRTGFLGFFGEKVDAIDYYTKEFNSWDKMAIEARESPQFDMTSVGFVTFENMASALIASQIAINPVPFRCRTANAYEPRNVLWKNIHISGKQRVIRDIIVWSVTIVLVVFWTVPISFISSLTSIDAIIEVAPGLGDFIEGSDFLQNIAQGLIPTALVNIFMQVLPLILDYLGVLQGLRARSAVSESTLSKYFFFLIFNVLLVFTLISTAINTVVILVKQPTEVARILATSLPKVSPFFINYTILHGLLLMPLKLLLLGSLIVRGFSIWFYAKTPREHANARSPEAFNYGSGYPQPLLIFIIVLEYSTISPIILVFGTLYFAITYVVYKYQFLYVYFRPYEAAGQLWTMVFPRVIAGMLLFQLTMLGLFILKNSFVLGALCIPLVIFTVIFKFTIDAAYARNSFHLPMQLLREQEKTGSTTKLAANDINLNSSQVNSSSINLSPADEKPRVARYRWSSALRTIQNTSRNRFTQPAKHQSKATQPRRHRMILDEDNYKATPDNKTDYQQPPMMLNPGVLDTGLKHYGNPFLVGELPQLWLPVKLHSTSGQTQPQFTSSLPLPISEEKPMDDASGDNSDQGTPGKQSSTTAMDIAQVVELIEQEHQWDGSLNQICIHDEANPPEPVLPPQHLSASSSPTPLSYFGRMLGFFKSQKNDSQPNNNVHYHYDNDNSSSSSSSSEDDDDSDDDHDNNPISAFHRIYYHHPERPHLSSANRHHSSFIDRLHTTPPSSLHQ